MNVFLNYNKTVLCIMCPPKYTLLNFLEATDLYIYVNRDRKQ